MNSARSYLKPLSADGKKKPVINQMLGVNTEILIQDRAVYWGESFWEKCTLCGALAQLSQDSLLLVNLYFSANTLTTSYQNKWVCIRKEYQCPNNNPVDILNSSHLPVIPILSTWEKLSVIQFSACFYSKRTCYKLFNFGINRLSQQS